MSGMSETHRVWRLGADIDTDLLAPGHAMKHGIETIAKHCLEAVRPEFAREVRRGDVIVAGPNFGIGSSREQAAEALVLLAREANERFTASCPQSLATSVATSLATP